MRDVLYLFNIPSGYHSYCNPVLDSPFFLKGRGNDVTWDAI